MGVHGFLANNCNLNLGFFSQNNSVPKTGDNTNTVVWMAVMFSSMTALAVVLKKKKEYEDR